MNETDLVYSIAYAAILLASVLRVAIPAWQKKREAIKRNETFNFDWGYVWIALESFVLGFIVSTFIFPLYVFPTETPQSFIYVFCFAFGYGWGQADIMMKTIKDWHLTPK